jgi:hypothetical protein
LADNAPLTDGLENIVVFSSLYIHFTENFNKEIEIVTLAMIKIFKKKKILACNPSLF